MAEFSLPAGMTSVAVAVAHRTLEEIWYFVSGTGQMWRRSEETGVEQVVTVGRGVALTIPRRTNFQLRADHLSAGPLVAVGTTVPTWPGIGDMSGRDEAYLVEGPWAATVESGADLS